MVRLARARGRAAFQAVGQRGQRRLDEALRGRGRGQKVEIDGMPSLPGQRVHGGVQQRGLAGAGRAGEKERRAFLRAFDLGEQLGALEGAAHRVPTRGVRTPRSRATSIARG